MVRKKSSQATSLLLGVRVTHLYLAGVIVLIAAVGYPLLGTHDDEQVTWKENPSLDTRVRVLNGCGAERIADEVSSCLRDAGFDIVGTGNADAFDYDRTIVIDRCGSIEKALRVGKALQCERVVMQRVRAPSSDVVVVVGADWTKLKAFGDWKRRKGRIPSF